MSAQVQRKLEFPRRKSSRLQKDTAVSAPKDSTPANLVKEKNPTRKSCRSTRKKQNENEENTGNVENILSSPRKRLSDDEDSVTILNQNSPSPSKKKKENVPVAQRRDETPIRSSLAQQLAAAKLQDNLDQIPIKELVLPNSPVRCPLSPLKLNGQPSGGLSSPIKSPSKVRNLAGLCSPVKSPSKVRYLDRLCSPLKSPTKVRHLDRLCSPVKSPLKVRPLSDISSPAKLRTVAEALSPAHRRLDVDSPLKSSPFKSPSTVNRKLDVDSPLKNSPLNSPSKVQRRLDVDSPLKSPVMKLAKPDCTAYHQAKQLFHTAKPERLVGRDKETSEIRAFLKGHMTKKTAGSLYISGAPGTGKTAVLTHLIDELKAVHSCKTVYLNCMTLDNSATVYGKLYSDITGKNAPTAKERLRSVEKVLTAEGPSIVMVLDEIDQLDSKNQEILYTIFEWPSLQKSRLILVGIANALDLTDRILPRLQARPNCKPKLLNFAPYTKDQISAILKDRIQDFEKDGTSVMDATAIQFCARKISAVAGDMRKALDVCRRAVELVESDVRAQQVLQSVDSGSNCPVKQSHKVVKKIGVVHINNVLSEVYGSGASAQQQETVPLQQKLVVCSLLLLLKQGKMKEVPAGKLHDAYCKVCKNRQMVPVDQSEYQGILTLLESRGMIGIKKAKETRMNKVTLKLDEKELEHTMQDKVLISTILKEGLPK